MVQVLEQDGGGSMVIVVWQVGSASSVRVRVFSPSAMGYGPNVAVVPYPPARLPSADTHLPEVLAPVTVISKDYVSSVGSVGLPLSWH